MDVFSFYQGDAMATFELTAPDGGTYHVDAPDEHAAVDALGQMIGGSKARAAAEPRSALQSIREAIHAPTRILENGFLLGLGDRARAVMDTAIRPRTLSDLVTGNEGSYVANLKREQGETEQFETAHPVAAPVLGVVGRAAAPLGAIAAAAKGVGLGAKMFYGAAAGGTIGGVQGALNSKDWTDLPQTAKDAGVGAVVGGVVGGALPATGKAIGAGYNVAANYLRGSAEGMSRGASKHLVDALMADGPAVQQRLAELGPDAMLADAAPAFLGKAQRASLNSDEGRSVPQVALTARDKDTNPRIMRDVNRA